MFGERTRLWIPVITGVKRANMAPGMFTRKKSVGYLGTLLEREQSRMSFFFSACGFLTPDEV